MRELKERLSSRSFLMLAFLGPLIVLGFIYLLFTYGGTSKVKWNVLISDPNGLMENKIMAKEDPNIRYAFANDYIEIEDFALQDKYKQFDALLEINEKVFSNKIAYFFYKEKPAAATTSLIQYQFERRLEEIMVNRFTDLSIEKFRQLKQPINLGLRNAYDPLNEQNNLSAWVGFFFGIIIVLFIFMFGMTILRSTMIEKSNRIVEVLLGSIQPQQLLFGKILGIGLSALIQFVIWFTLIALGLFTMREWLFVDLLDASKFDIAALSAEAKNFSMQENLLRSSDYNQFIELVYDRIQYGNILFYFVIILLIAYLFYATFFASLGAVSGSESDGQQFIIPLLGILFFAIYAGYFAINNINHPITSWLSFIPFTSPVVCMVKIASGYAEGTTYQLFVSLLILLLSASLMLYLAGRLYKNGILQFGHRVSFKHIINWIKRA